MRSMSPYVMTNVSKEEPSTTSLDPVKTVGIVETGHSSPIRFTEDSESTIVTNEVDFSFC